jgi:hypothetical protein
LEFGSAEIGQPWLVSQARRVYAISAICLLYHFINLISNRWILASGHPILDILCPVLQFSCFLFIRAGAIDSASWVLFGSAAVHSTYNSFFECTSMIPSRILVIMTIASCSVGAIFLFLEK